MKQGAALFADGAGRYAYVSAGFSWPAFFLGPLWAVAKRRWHLLALMLAMELCLWFGSQFADGQELGPLTLLMACCELGYLLARGWFGNRWLEAALRQRGYAPVQP